MDYKIIDNLSSSNNHWTHLKDLFEKSDSVILASPFLMTDFADFLGEIDLSKLEKFHLITTLCPKAFDQINKVSSLVSLIDFPAIKGKKINCQISLDNKLHGKIYIFRKKGDYISAFISSANFTGSGLSRNHEWGVEIYESFEIENLKNSILKSIEFSEVSFDEIYRMQKATTEFLERQPQTEIRNIDLNLTDLLANGWSKNLDNTIEFWLKPIGVSNNPVSEERLFNQIEDHLHFSKQRPNGIKPNDLLIAYGVGTTKMLSVYRATSFPIRVPQQEIDDDEDGWLERWPWYVVAENLTPNFGATWPRHNLFTNSLVRDYLSANPNKSITAVGGKTLGGLNFGKDKLKLAPEFAKYIIDKIMAINNGF